MDSFIVLYELLLYEILSNYTIKM